MNTPGMANYSRETVGLRQPVQIKDQQFRLIYVYPMLFADVINQMEEKTDLRNFLSISFLREIFVSNSLNIIQMASQIPSVNQKENNVAQLIGNAVLSSRGTSTSLPAGAGSMMTYNDSSYQLQNRVETKTNQIMKYLLTDTRTKKLLPQIEIVTLNNLIDVPVIVGTKDYGIPTYPLIYVLLIAIATNTPLDKYSNIEKIVRSLKNTREEDWIKLLSSFTGTEKDVDFFARWAKDHPDFKNRSQLGRLTGWLSRKLGISKDDKIPVEKRDLAPKRDYDSKEENDLFNILKLIRNSLDDLLLYFKFVLNPDMLRQQTGLDLSNNSMETTVMKLSTNQYQIFTTMYDKFMELIAVPGSVFLSSVFNTLYPISDNSNSNIVDLQGNPIPVQSLKSLNFLELKEKHFDAGLGQKIQTLIFDTFVTEIKNNLSQYSPDEVQEKVNLLKKVCSSLVSMEHELDESVRMFFTNDNQNVIRSINFTENNFESFTSSIHEFASSFLSQNKRLENVFSQIVKNGPAILKIAQTQIYSSIEDFMRDIYTNSSGGRYVSAMEFQFPDTVSSDDVRRTYIPQITDTLFVIFYFFFLYRLQSALCEYIQVLDIEIEAKVHDVIDFPNYTMVITTDVLKAVYTAHMASSLKNLMSGDQMYHVGKMTQNNIKGMMKVLRNKLKIPSMIVQDTYRKEYYYQFMFMSAPEKMSGTTLDSFIKANNIIKKY